MNCLAVDLCNIFLSVSNNEHIQRAAQGDYEIFKERMCMCLYMSISYYHRLNISLIEITSVQNLNYLPVQNRLIQKCF